MSASNEKIGNFAIYCSYFEVKNISMLMVFLFPFLAYTSEVPSSFTYQGRLYANDGVTPLASNVDLKLQIFDPTATCLLYEESQTNIALSDGLFSVSVGSNIGSTRRGSSDPGLAMGVIFSNESVAIRSASSPNCSAGYTPLSGDKRKLKVTVYNRTSGEATILSPLQELSMNPYSMIANKSGDTFKLGGKSSSEFIQVEGSSVTQSKVKQLTDNVTGLLNLLSGNVSVSDTPSGASSAVNKTYVDSKVSSVTPNATCVSGSFNRWNGTAWVCEADQNNGGGGTPADATTTSKGIVQIGSGLAVTSGTVRAAIDDTDVTGTINISKIAGKGTASLYNVPVTGNAGTSDLVKGDDSRLIDARTPIDNSVSTAKIVDGAVTTSKIADGAVDNAKLPATITKNLQGDVTGNLTGNVTGNLTGNVTGTLLGVAKLSDSSTCDNSTKGTIKYVAVDDKFYGCKGTTPAWTELGAGAGGGVNQLSVSSSEPYACDSGKDGSIALTAMYTTCVCRNGTGWVSAQNGLSVCSWNSTTSIVDIFGDNSALALYKFESNTSDSNNSFNGTSSGVSYVTGKFGQAVTFGDAKNMQMSQMFTNGTSATFSFWVYPLSSANAILFIGYPFASFSGQRGFTFSYDFVAQNYNNGVATANNSFQVYNAGNTNVDIGQNLNSSAITKNVWNHVVFVFNQPNFTIYVNGVSQGTVTNAAWTKLANFTASSNWVLGDSLYTSNATDTYFDQVRVFNKALSASEVNLLYNEQ
jgi:hypothetical protein